MVCFIFSGAKSSAFEPVYTNYSTKDGLPSSEVYDIVQDSRGHLWFATDRGIAEYNGYEFITHGTDEGIPNISVIDFFPQKNGEVWAYTYSNEIFYFSIEQFDGFHAYRFNDSLAHFEHQPIMVPNDLFVARNGFVYLEYTSTNKVGYLVIDTTGRIESHISSYSGTEKRMFNVINVDEQRPQFGYFTYDTTNIQWALRNDPILRVRRWNYMEDVRLLALMVSFETYLISDDTVVEIHTRQKLCDNIAIGRFSTDQIWVGTRGGGIEFYDLKGNFTGNILSGKKVSHALFDHEGNFWVSTLNSGVFCVKSFDIQESEEWKQRPIYSLNKHNKNLIIIAENGDIVIQGNKGESSEYISKENRNIPQPVLIPDHMDKCYYYFENNRMEYDFSTHTSRICAAHFTHVKNISESSSPYILLGNGWFSVLQDSNNWQEKMKRLNTKLIDGVYWKQKYYLSTLRGLYVLDNLDQDGYNIDVPELNVRLSDIEVFGDHLLLGSIGGGLMVFDGKNARVIHELDANVINEMTVENDSTVWVGTNQGVFRLIFRQDMSVATVEHVNYSMGLPGNEVTDVEFIGDTAYVSTSKGLARILKSYWTNYKKSNACFLRFTDIYANDQRMELNRDSLLSLAHFQNRLEIKFEQIVFKEQNPVYWYALTKSGEQLVWRTTNNRNVVYSSLEPGDYEFVLEGSDLTGARGGKKIKLKIYIAEAWYNTIWFYASLIFVLIGIIYTGFRYRLFIFNPIVLDELVRVMAAKISNSEKVVVFKENGIEKQIKTAEIHFMKSDGNYVDIVTTNKTHTVRSKIGQILDHFPDPNEFARIHRSYIVRIDKVDGKGKKSLLVNGAEIPVSPSYQKQLDRIIL